MASEGEPEGNMKMTSKVAAGPASAKWGEPAEVEALTRDECLELLRGTATGCLALATDGAPRLRPVNFIVDDWSIIVRTGEGQILDAAREGRHASFQVLDSNGFEHTGASVNVAGKLEELETNELLLALPLRPWASGQRDRFVKLSVAQISGRRIPPGRGNR
ncbi:MAG: pyridoxamine 5'-phosphate oxidase family protein [Myxococcota bacterium]|nr:pyridoxamine 5'-phosphate oxidase family protein [Myxococcota bacterium]